MVTITINGGAVGKVVATLVVAWVVAVSGSVITLLVGSVGADELQASQAETSAEIQEVQADLTQDVSRIAGSMEYHHNLPGHAVSLERTATLEKAVNKMSDNIEWIRRRLEQAPVTR